MYSIPSLSHPGTSPTAWSTQVVRPLLKWLAALRVLECVCATAVSGSSPSIFMSQLSPSPGCVDPLTYWTCHTNCHALGGSWFNEPNPNHPDVIACKKRCATLCPPSPSPPLPSPPPPSPPLPSEFRVYSSNQQQIAVVAVR